jgi:hypothetical protein
MKSRASIAQAVARLDNTCRVGAMELEQAMKWSATIAQTVVKLANICLGYVMATAAPTM